MSQEQTAGREPQEVRNKQEPVDALSPPRRIELKTVGGGARGQAVPLEQRHDGGPDRGAGRAGGAGFGQHPDAEIYRSQPGLGVILGARVLAEFGDDPGRYADAKARKNYSGMSPITKASGTKRIVLARFARNRRLGDALFLQAFAALNNSPGARAFYDRQRARGATHYQALRALANRLVGILHGCLGSHTLYQEHHAWHTEPDKLSSAA
jgi:transposase